MIYEVDCHSFEISKLAVTLFCVRSLERGKNVVPFAFSRYLREINWRFPNYNSLYLKLAAFSAAKKNCSRSRDIVREKDDPILAVSDIAYILFIIFADAQG